MEGKHRASEGMHVPFLMPTLIELNILSLEVPSSKTGRVLLRYIAYLKAWPEGQVDGRWPSMLGVEQLFPRALAEVPNGLLNNPILEMGVDTAEGEPLI